MSFHPVTRRDMLLGSGALFAWTQLPRLARAEGRDPRLLVIILRGALDGLGAVAPVGDPDWIGLRGDRALVIDGKTPALPLDAFFALNPAMPNFYRLYKTGQASIVHATATPYRERSHFDGQDVLESGITRPGAVDTGWLNRALLALESDGRVNPGGGRALGIGAVTLVVRGKAPVMSWVPQRLLPASEDTRARLLDLYQHTDPKLAAALQARIQLAAIGGVAKIDDPMQDASPATPPVARLRSYVAEGAGAAARLLAKADGPRVGAVGFGGWDTHINEGAVSGQLANLLGVLDGGLAAIETNMGDAWRETAVVVVTEFGRTAKINGTDGTDHGTALSGTRPEADHRSARGAQGPAQGSFACRGERARKQRIPRQRRRVADRRAGRLTSTRGRVRLTCPAGKSKIPTHLSLSPARSERLASLASAERWRRRARGHPCS
jgi:uncharacterized protein (DUF1501 family)